MKTATGHNFLAASDHSLLVRFGDEMSPENQRNILGLTHLLLHHPRDGIRNIHPAYSSVLITIDPLVLSLSEAERFVGELFPKLDSIAEAAPRLIEIPVCYEGEFGPDLAEVASHNKLSEEEVVRIHASGEYTVCFLGFMPGFPYLSGMDNRIAAPRRQTPRLRVPGGAVGIGGKQTGIYPLDSPGGWEIIGRTPIQLFDVNKQSPALLEMGDHVRFISISLQQFEEMRAAQSRLA